MKLRPVEMMIGMVVLLLALLLAWHAAAHDHNRPELTPWMKSLHSKGKTWCCDGNDTDAIDDWDTKGGRYRVKFRGQWFDVPDSALVEGPNKGGGALLWMDKGWSGLAVRCFMPGSMT